MLVATVLIAGCLVHSALGVDFSAAGLADVEHSQKKFSEDTVGLDLHNDYFYFSDDKASDAYKRTKYVSMKVTLAGQRPDLTQTSRPAATNPFAVAQMASTPIGSLMDRWDYKQSENGNQFFGLYHGVGKAFVVNKLRAQLLRRVANEVQDFLPYLDQSLEDPQFKDNKEYQEDVRETVSHVIKTVYAEIDESIRKSMAANDDSYAAATVVIVTQKYVIIVNSGDARVLSYDSTSMLRDLSSAAAISSTPAVTGQRKEFGANKSKSKGLAEPDMAFFERSFLDADGDPSNIQFLTIQSGVAASSVSDEETKKIVISQVDAHKYREENEQDLHKGVVSNLLRTASSKSGVKRWMANLDFSAIFVALETEYKRIH